MKRLPSLSKALLIAALACETWANIISSSAIAADYQRKSEVKYHAESDTFFQYVTDFTREASGVNWADARQIAASLIYHDRQGRLATVDTPEKHVWLMESFPLEGKWGEGATWIGLRYWCSARMLTWVNGNTVPPTSFQPWAVPWARGHVQCGHTRDVNYMGVYYKEDRRWQAVGEKKRFPSFFVEFPPNHIETEHSRAAE